jgi:hypothetical protein
MKPLSPFFLASLLIAGAFSLSETMGALPTPGDLVISEIHYNPYDPTPEEIAAGWSASDFEFLEIHNVTNTSLNLTNVTISGGIDFTFPTFSLPANGYTVVARKPDAFALRYPSASTPGNYAGKLSNAGEQLIITSSSDTVLLDVTYDSVGQWPGRPDGNGSSLELVDPDNAQADFNAPSTWRASSEFDGSPENAGAGPDNRIVFNEVRSNPAHNQVDAIELLNTTDTAIDISGWLISDNSGVYPSFTIPPDTTLAAGAYIVFDETAFNAPADRPVTSYSGTANQTTVTATAHGLNTGDTITIEGYGGTGLYNGSWQITRKTADTFTIETPYVDNHTTKGNWTPGRPFGLSSSNGEDLWLLETDNNGKPIKFIDHVDFAAAFNGETLGRWPNGEGIGTLVSMTENTLGSENTGAQVGPIIVSEVMYAPNPPAGQTEEDFFEFVEIYNAGTHTEDLANWRMRGGADFNFTSSHSLAPGETLIVVAFDPATNTTASTAFRDHYGIDTTLPLVGPFLDGPLDNAGGTVRLQRPDTPPVTDPSFYPQVTEDEVRYLAESPWPTDTTGTGNSINRISDTWFGNFATSWESDTATPGGKRLYYTGWSESYFGPGSPPGSGKTDDFDADGTPNLVEFALSLNPTVADADLAPKVLREGSVATLTYTSSALKSGITYRAEYSENLTSWTPATENILSETNFTQTLKAISPPATNGKMFMRIFVDTP